MIQSNLMEFEDKLSYKAVLILKDLNVAWFDRNYFLEKNDICSDVPSDLAGILISRGVAKELHFGGDP